MDITLNNTPVSNLKQIEAIVPKLIGAYTLKYPNVVSVVDEVFLTLTSTEIFSIQNFQFDPCLAYSKYDPDKVNKKIRDFDAINAMLAPLVGGQPPDVSTYEFCSMKNGLDASGNIRPLGEWRMEPDHWGVFRLSSCYTP